ncbi:MAG: uroporphyrinogen-III C-methyltransferase [Acetobacteraceae bacterium]|nr:uroporphyrinogen-III C-methyltransferase [Acetobacteraceae bacterium]
MSPRPPAEPGYFPIFLRLDDEPVLVVGDGDEASSKARLLSQSGARVRVIATHPCDDLQALAQDRTIELAPRAFVPTDLEGARLCVVALEDEASAAGVVSAAREARVLVNAVDKPALCDFIVPAIVDRAPVTVAIGTEGAAPALARELRSRIEAAVPPGTGAFAALCRRYRPRVARAIPDREGRRRFWDAVVKGPEWAAALDGELERAESLLVERLEAARAGRMPKPRGRATLVGAGPGDPELLTLRAVRAIKSADVVLYDALVEPAIVDLARRDARRIDVGKRCGRHAISQAAINRLILHHAQAGAHVVRLKGGDPLIFSRGGEEIETLREAGLRVAIIPGITAACAAAARLGIPLTHRDVARSLHFITGHGRDGAVPSLDWALLARGGGTIAAYMATRTLTTVAARLLEAGLPASTPAVAVENASRPNQRHLLGTIGDLPVRLAAQGFTGPTLVLIGAVAAMAVPEAVRAPAAAA